MDCAIGGKYGIGKTLKISPKDAWVLFNGPWFAEKMDGRGRLLYASKRHPVRPGLLRMHRLILNPPPGFEVDHINGDGLDNRRENLRIVTHKQNIANRKNKAAGKSSKFVGVSYRTTGRGKKRWCAHIVRDGRQKYLGSYLTEQEAVIARAAAEAPLD